MPDNDKPPRAPAGLSSAGNRYWRLMVENYIFDVEKLELLKQAARTVDLLDRLQSAIDSDETLRTFGSQKQIVQSPEVSAIKEHRALLIALTKALELPSEANEQPGRVMTRSEQASHAASFRWNHRSRVSG